MTAYLLDENVFRECHAGGHRNVVAWFAGVEEDDLRLSVMTLFEKRRGWERQRRKRPMVADAKLAELSVLEKTLGKRLLPIDAPVAAEWARLLGASDKDRRDRALVATARVHDLVLVTRNIADMRRCDVRVLDPFRRMPKIETV